MTEDRGQMTEDFGLRNAIKGRKAEGQGSCHFSILALDLEPFATFKPYTFNLTPHTIWFIRELRKLYSVSRK